MRTIFIWFDSLNILKYWPSYFITIINVFINPIKNCWSQQGKSSCLFWLKTFCTIWLITHDMFSMHLPSYYIPLIHWFSDSIEHCWWQQGKSTCFSEWIQFFMIILITHFLCTHLHNSSLSFIVLSIQLYMVSNSKVIAVVSPHDWMQYFYNFTHCIFLMKSYSYFITLIHRFFNSIKHSWWQKGNRSCF